MATLVRELGFPARVAIGYRPGQQQGNTNTYVVSSTDAHAWVEVWFGEGFGWLPFDPTPQGSRPVAPAGSYLSPSTDGNGKQGSTSTQTPEGGSTEPATCRRGLSPQLCHSDHALLHHPGFGQRAIAILFVLAIAIPPAKAIRRRLSLRRARVPRERVLAAYRVFDGEAADLGLGRLEAETFEEYRARLAASVALTDGHLSRLTEAAVRAAYASGEPSEAEIRAASEAARDAIRGLRKGAGLAKRVVGSYRPSW
jgi:hypothetical protein